MYYHGINAEYLQFHYPVINPVRSEHRKTVTQLKDGYGLKKRFGFEPVHLLVNSESLSKQECIIECSNFGDTVFVFDKVLLPILCLSKHERGVPILDLREAMYCYITKLANVPILTKYAPDLPIRIINTVSK